MPTKIKATVRKFRRSIFIAGFIYFLDAFVFNQGGIALLVALCALVVGGLRALFAFLKKNKQLCGERLIRASIYIYMAALVFASNYLNNRIANLRAQKLIQACNSYQAKYQHYPSKLADLMPEFISKVPLAKFTLGYNAFIYVPSQKEHLLAYYVLPPFSRWVYNFEIKRWIYLD